MKTNTVLAKEATGNIAYSSLPQQPKQVLLVRSVASVPRVQCSFECILRHSDQCRSFSHNSLSGACELFNVSQGSSSGASGGSTGPGWSHYQLELDRPKCRDRDCGITLMRDRSKNRTHLVCNHGWSVIQNRENSSIHGNFDRSYQDYVDGFDDIQRDFWWGLEKLYNLTSSRTYRLRVEMTQSVTGTTFYQEYSEFRIGLAADGYNLTVSGSTGSAGDGFFNATGAKFTAYDNDQDQLTPANCASINGGGWWFKYCFDSNNGANLNGPMVPCTGSVGALWRALETTTLYLGLNNTRMMIK